MNLYLLMDGPFFAGTTSKTKNQFLMSSRSPLLLSNLKGTFHYQATISCLSFNSYINIAPESKIFS